jgi:hypothetical protein
LIVRNNSKDKENIAKVKTTKYDKIPMSHMSNKRMIKAKIKVEAIHYTKGKVEIILGDL